MAVRQLDPKTCINICKCEKVTTGHLKYLVEYTTSTELIAVTQSAHITPNICGLKQETRRKL